MTILRLGDAEDSATGTAGDLPSSPRSFWTVLMDANLDAIVVGVTAVLLARIGSRFLPYFGDVTEFLEARAFMFGLITWLISLFFGLTHRTRHPYSWRRPTVISALLILCVAVLLIEKGAGQRQAVTKQATQIVNTRIKEKAIAGSIDDTPNRPSKRTELENLARYIQDDVTSSFDGAVVRLGLGQYEKAIELLDQALDSAKGEPKAEARVLYYLGITHQFNKEYDLALKYYDNSLVLNPAQPGLQFSRVMTLVKLKDTAKARTILESTSYQTNGSDNVSYRRGIGYYALEDYVLAEENLRVALGQDSTSVDVLILLARVLAEKHTVDESEIANLLQRALALRPGHPEATAMRTQP